LDNARLALDYIEVFIWPSVVIAVVAVLVWRFRSQLGGLIDRIRTVNIAGLAQLGASPGPQPEGRPAEGPAVSEGELKAIVEELERTYGGQIDQLQQDYSGLWQRWTTAELYLFYERIYRVIYGTQIRLLQFLQLRGAGGASTQEVWPFFQEHVAAARALPGYVPRFEVYVGYLTGPSQLVTLQPGTGRYVISAYGEGLLRYLVAFGIPMWRPY